MTSSLSKPANDAPAAVIRLRRADSDEALVLALRAGRPGAGQALFDSYGGYVRKILTRVLGPDPDIGDLTQDVFVVALESLTKLEEPRALRGWLAQIAVFRARRRIRDRKQWSIMRFFGPEELPPGKAAHHDFEASEALQAAYRVLASLKTDDRIAFALRFVEGMDLSEVAAACRVSLATAKRRLARAQASFLELARSEPALADWTGGAT
jgi:RNA polymerase sigma-70 factor (ECF subfamily)